jgi:Protein of unknown function (DUF3237)
MTTFQPIVPQLKHLLQVTVMLETPLVVGALAVGTRRIIPITGGHFTGPKLSGVVLPGGADWQLVQTDGVALLDARYTLQTHDGALIYVQNRGVRHGPPEILAAIARGEEVDPAHYYMRTTPIFETELLLAQQPDCHRFGDSPRGRGGSRFLSGALN